MKSTSLKLGRIARIIPCNTIVNIHGYLDPKEVMLHEEMTVETLCNGLESNLFLFDRNWIVYGISIVNNSLLIEVLDN